MESVINLTLYVAMLFTQVIIQVTIVVASAVYHLTVAGFQICRDLISEWRARSLADTDEQKDYVAHS